MNTRNKELPSQDGQQMLATLRQIVAKTLEKKRRLGQYAVIWKNGKPVVTGEDAPDTNRTTINGVGDIGKETDFCSTKAVDKSGIAP